MSSNEPPRSVGPYRIEARLGAGGMGEVFRAFDERLERRVALKQIRTERAGDPRARQRFLREARLAARLNHPSLAPIHDILEQDDFLWIVMELVEGESLARRLERGSLELTQALTLAIDIADGLAAIHAAGILHRDLKSENVLINTRGAVRIVDFGLAKSEGSEGELSSSGDLLGTPRAMSPEQARGEALSPASDLFALGVLLYEMLRGTPPFRGNGALETLAQVCHGSHESLLDHLPELPLEISRLVDRLLAKDSVERPESAEAVRVVLERIERIHRPPDSQPEPTRVDRPDAITLGEEERPWRTGERRQLTVLCCELVAVSSGGTERDSGDSLDPEQLSEVLPAFQRAVHRAIDRYDVYLEDFKGHRAVLCLGYPKAHEDSAQRAILTGLAILEGWGEARGVLAPTVVGNLEARVGIHTGSAVVLALEGGRLERLVLAQTLDWAVATQKQAKPGTLVVSETTHGIVEGLFDVRRFESTTPDSASELRTLFRIERPRDPDDPTFWKHGAAMVGRQRELDFLVNRHRLAREGAGQTILVTAEAGLGKTRLLREFRGRLGGEVPWLLARGRSHDRHRALEPVAALVRQAFGLAAARTPDPPQTLGDWIGALGLPNDEIEPVLAELVRGSASKGPFEISDGERQRAVAVVVEVLLEAIERDTDGATMVLVFEDLQWMDSATLAVMARLVEQAAGAPMLLIATTRPRPVGGGASRGPTTVIHLDALETEQARAMGADLSRRFDHDPRTLDGIVERARGVPGHLEALVRSSADNPSDDSLPPRLVESLAAELDRLGSAREVAQLAAAFEKTFSLEELEALGPLDTTTLEHEIERLVDARVFEPAVLDPTVLDPTALDPTVQGERRWRFRRPLLQEVALGSWLAEDLETLQTEAEKLILRRGAR